MQWKSTGHNSARKRILEVPLTAPNQLSCGSVKTKISTMTEVDRAHRKQAVEHQHRNCASGCFRFSN